jgi:CubicO group peptidase (beta-lactamase class C family)
MPTPRPLLVALGILVPFFALVPTPGTTQSTEAQWTEGMFPRAEPHEVGMSAERLEAAVQAAYRWVDEGEIGGGVLTVIRHGRLVLHEAFGWADLDERTPMTTDHIFLSASMTKPLTGTAVLRLHEAGRVELDAPAVRYVPEFDAPDTQEITVRQLLTHTSGLPAWTSGLESGSHAALVRAIAEDGLRTPPGTEFHYSDRGSTVLGYLVERVSGQPLMEYLTREILEPLEMQDSYVMIEASDPRLARVPPRYQMGEEGLELWQTDRGVERTFLGGSGGLFTTTLDYARFLTAFAQGGVPGGVRLLSDETVAYATRKHEARPDGMYDYGLHWGIGLRGIACDGISHGGSRGTLAYLDREHDLMVLYFTQTRSSPTRVSMVQMVHDAVER